MNTEEEKQNELISDKDFPLCYMPEDSEGWFCKEHWIKFCEFWGI